jgi:cytochrome c oxidase assembly protein subunit 11
VLGPGERVDMPVTFFVDPAMLDDLEARGITDITLSYTMYPAAPPEASRGAEGRVAAAPADDGRTVER